MGARKRLRAEKLKDEKKQIAVAQLNDSKISPRKMRLVADLIRGVEVNKALNILSHNSKFAAVDLAKLLRSAISNWEQKNEMYKIDKLKKVSAYILLLQYDTGNKFRFLL